MNYISILDYSRGTVCVIEDEDDVTHNMGESELLDLLNVLGFRESDINYMVTKDNPDYSTTTLKELCKDLDEDVLEEYNLKRLLGNEE